MPLKLVPHTQNKILGINWGFTNTFLQSSKYSARAMQTQNAHVPPGKIIISSELFKKTLNDVL